MACLISLNPSLGHREYDLPENGVVVGRDLTQCEIVVAGDTVSRRHFRVFTTGANQFFIEDLHSTNGVFVNREQVSGQVLLQDGDAIGVGIAQPEYFRFQLESGRDVPWTVLLPVADEWTVGRWMGCDIALSFESSVSSVHAVVRRKGDVVSIVDRGSLNGVWVNGRSMRKATLKPTDTVNIGSTALRFEVQSDGALSVTRRECGDDMGIETVALTREVPNRGGGKNAPKLKRLLDSVALSIRPGEFIGILGPSGAGKSTLLNALNGYNPPNYGCVLVNETPLYRSFAMFRNIIGYVPQDDIVHGDLTVEDSINYVARLRLPPDITKKQRRDLVDSTIETLGLSHVRLNRINQLSGGQRKRVSIGCELITRPGILFLDEPTSGMDPSTEERLMLHFQSLSQRGTTVLITTHILYNLALLDRVIIMARGKLVFFGTPAEALVFFSDTDDPLERPTRIFEILEALDAPDDNGVQGDPADAAAEAYQRKYRESEYYERHILGEYSDVARQMTVVSEKGKAPSGSAGGDTSPLNDSTGTTATGTQHYKTLLQKPTAGATNPLDITNLFSPRSFLTLTQRQFAIKLVSLKRAAFYLAVPLVLAIVTLSLRTTDFPDDVEMAEKKTAIYDQIHGDRLDLGDPIKALLSPDGADDPTTAEDIVFAIKHEGIANLPTPISVLIMFVMTAVFMGTLMSCLDLSPERPIYIHERMSSQRIMDYVGSKLPFLLFITAIQSAVFLAVCYAKPGLRECDLPTAYLALVALSWTSCAMGLFLSAADPSPGQFSVILAIIFVLPQLVLSGGLGPDFYTGMSSSMQIVANLFPARWGLEMLMTSFYDHPDHEALQWVDGFVHDVVGFDFGRRVFLNNVAILMAQALGWLILCGFALKRLDKVR